MNKNELIDLIDEGVEKILHNFTCVCVGIKT